MVPRTALAVELLTTGMILALGLLNGILGATLRDRVYLWYAAAMGAFVVYQDVETALPQGAGAYACFVLYVALIAAFARAFLDLPHIAPPAWRIIIATGAFVALEESAYAVWPGGLRASGLASSLDPLARAAFLLAVFSAGIVAWRRGSPAARFYCIAFAGVAIGLIVGASGDYGVIPRTGLTDAAPGAGVAWEALFLSVALADRIRVLDAKAAVLEGERDALEAVAYRDALTGVANRRAFERRLQEEWSRGLREATRLAVVLVDVDHFKAYNDAYGHLKGDRALARIGAAIAGTLGRPDDLVARYGGEEFVIVLPGCSRADAARVASSMRVAVRDLRIPHAQSEFGRITISAGVASTVPRPERKAGALVAAADRMLYAAKDGGRDRVASATRPKPAA